MQAVAAKADERRYQKNAVRPVLKGFPAPPTMQNRIPTSGLSHRRAGGSGAADDRVARTDYRLLDVVFAGMAR